MNQASRECHWKYLRLIGSSIALIFIGSCASTSLMEANKEGSIKEEVPQEFQQKFSVNEEEAKPVAEVVPEKTEKPAKPEPKKAVTKKEEKKKAAFSYPVRRNDKTPVKVGEISNYEITFFGMVAGLFKMEVAGIKEINARKVYHLKANARTSKVFSFFYTLDDNIESFWDYEGLFSHRFQLNFQETDQVRESIELYDSEKKVTYFRDKVVHKKKGKKDENFVKPIEPFPQDMISFFYYLRSVNYPEKGSVSFPIVSEGKTWEALVTVVRREMSDTPFGKVKTLVLKPETKFGGRFEKRGDSFIWMTDDDRRVITRVEAKIKIGKIKAVLKDFKAGT